MRGGDAASVVRLVGVLFAFFFVVAVEPYRIPDEVDEHSAEENQIFHSPLPVPIAGGLLFALFVAFVEVKHPKCSDDREQKR